MITHGACGKSWTGLSRAHCPACHETFNSETAADKHRTGKYGGERRCLSPADAGLVGVGQTWGLCWQTPSDGAWAAARREGATA